MTIKRKRQVASRLKRPAPAAWAESVRLWPDPSDAPDVPPEHILRQYLEAPSALASEVRSQILDSVNCQRALERVQSPKIKMTDRTSCFLKGLPMPQVSLPKMGNQVQDAPCLQPVAPTAGEIWRCASKVEISEHGQIRNRRTYQPMDVLILSQPSPTLWADQVCQAVVCSPRELWPEPSPRAGDFVFQDQAGAQWVAHAPFAGPVVRDSLERRMSVVSSNQVAAVAAAVLKKPAVSVHRFERARLAARASYAFATARARQAKIRLDVPVSIPDCFQRHHKETEPIMLLAAGTKSPPFTRIRTRVFAGANPFESGQAGHGVCAAVLVPLHRVETPANGVRGVWKIEEDDPVFRRGSQVSLVSRSNPSVVVTGTVAADGLTIEFRCAFAGSDADLVGQDWFIWRPEHA